MPHVAALYRYPVKGFTPEACDELTVLESGRVAVDRVLGFRMTTPRRGNAWAPKGNFLVMMNTPGLARLTLTYDHDAQRLRIAESGGTLVNTGLDVAGRAELVKVVTEFVRGLEESPVVFHPERLPLRLIGDGETSRFQDRTKGFITLHSRESLASIAAALNDTSLDERRFRSNVSIEGLEPWEELAWKGKRIRIGNVQFRFAKVLTRCLATHANPQTGERDRLVMNTLVKSFSQKEPTFGIALLPDGAGGVIRTGDKVTVL